MRKKFAFFFLSCSVLLMLGHSFLPHNHIEQNFDRSELKSGLELSIAEILKVALANNLGANHLEEFKNDKNLDFDKFNVSGDCIFLHEFQNLSHHHLPYKASVIPSKTPRSTIDFRAKDNSLRAPPV